MNTKTLWKWSLGLLLAALPFAGGCDQETANSAPAITAATDSSSGTVAKADDTNAPSPEAAEQQLENAPETVVAPPATPPPNVSMSVPANEITKLAQSGVDENVMVSYVTNSRSTFNLSSDAIIYLNDIGVPSTVVAAMIQHDQSLNDSSASAGPPPPDNTAVYTPPNTPPAGYENQPPPDVADNGNGSYSYFYGSLAPYGTWIQVGGYGLCWQPATVVVNPGWSPYADRGHWLNTDCGWSWASDYSWGWAPFHYGRWFRHARFGWCWAPDSVWGPAWVSWRYSHDNCGWAPLPPSACFTPGIGFTYFGRHVGFNFEFGLSVNSFMFVGFDHFADRRWQSHRVPDREVRGFFHNTVVTRNIVENNRRIINEGVPVSRVAAAAHHDIPRVHIRDASDPVSALHERDGRIGGGVAVYPPQMPVPVHQANFVGQGIAPATRTGTPGLMSSRSAPGFRNEPLPGKNQPLPGFQNKPMPGNNAPLGFRNEPLSPGHSLAQPRSPREQADDSRATLRTPDASHPSANVGRAPGLQSAPPQVSRPAPSAHSAVPILRNQSQNVMRSESPAPQAQSPQVFRQESPRQIQPQQRVFTPPSVPMRSQPAARPYQWAPAAEPREQHSWNPPQQAAPVFHAQPAPQFHPQPAPSAPARVESAPQAQRSYSAPQSSGSHSGRD